MVSDSIRASANTMGQHGVDEGYKLKMDMNKHWTLVNCYIGIQQTQDYRFRTKESDQRINTLFQSCSEATCSVKANHGFPKAHLFAGEAIILILRVRGCLRTTGDLLRNAVGQLLNSWINLMRILQTSKVVYPFWVSWKVLQNKGLTAMKSVFVTVGTTSFDDLITAVTDPEATQILQDLGYNKLVLQIGHGKVCPDSDSTGTFTLEVFRFKDSISEDMQRADLVISHAGAGSCLEVLEARKPLLVVVNDRLMDNHQLELARQLRQDGHLFYCTPRTLVETLSSMDLTTLKPFPPGKPEKFAAFLDKVFGS